jgi:hypothetical protein
MMGHPSRILNASAKRVPTAAAASYRDLIMRSVFVLIDCRGGA